MVSIEENAEREDDECVFCVFTLEEKEEEAEEKEGELTMSFIVNRAEEEEVAAVAEGERPSEAQEAPSLQEDRLPTDSDSNGDFKKNKERINLASNIRLSSQQINQLPRS